jgi:ribosomal protein L30E
VPVDFIRMLFANERIIASSEYTIKTIADIEAKIVVLLSGTVNPASVRSDQNWKARFSTLDCGPRELTRIHMNVTFCNTIFKVRILASLA